MSLFSVLELFIRFLRVFDVDFLLYVIILIFMEGYNFYFHGSDT